ncbi:MAG TPA: ATP-binding protein [Terriglobales bacterium]|nr:ATP-binding protein [Terriglobales bacterium]
MSESQLAEPFPRQISPPPVDEKFLEALCDGLADAVFVFELSSQRVVRWSKGAEELFRCPAEEILQGKLDKLFTLPSLFGNRLLSTIADIEKTGSWKGEGECRVRDGSRIVVEASGTLLPGHDGSFVVMVVRNLTKLKEMENHIHLMKEKLAKRLRVRTSDLMATRVELEKTDAERKQTEQLFELLMHNLVNYAILILNPEGRVTHWNRGVANVLGYDDDEVDQEPFARFYKTENSDQRLGELLEIAQSRGSFRGYDWLARKDGSRFYSRSVVLPLRDEEAALSGYVVLLRDDTDQREFREKRKEKEQLGAMGTASAILVHEIKNPLNGMSTTVQLLERYLTMHAEPARDVLASTVRDLRSEIDRLQLLLADFQNISRPEKATFQRVSLPEVLREALQAVGPERLKQKIDVVKICAPDLPAVEGNPDRLEQAFINLIKNACEAMPNGGTLTLRAYIESHNPEEVYVEIADTGQGVPQGLNVFEDFKTTKTGGTGLGLVIVRQIILAHDGSISYSSQPGQGTTFKVSLPVYSTRQNP